MGSPAARVSHARSVKPFHGVPTCVTAPGRARVGPRAQRPRGGRGPIAASVRPGIGSCPDAPHRSAIHRNSARHERSGTAARQAQPCLRNASPPAGREAQEDEDDRGAGTWSGFRADEPQESVEDPLGLQRPTDRADEADPEALGTRSRNCRRRVSSGRQVARKFCVPVTHCRGRRAASLARDGPSILRKVGFPGSGVYRRPGAIVRETAPALRKR